MSKYRSFLRGYWTGHNLRDKILLMLKGAQDTQLNQTSGKNKIRDISKFFLRESVTLYDDSKILPILAGLDNLDKEFWYEYLIRLNQILFNPRDYSTGTVDVYDRSLDDLGVLTNIANILLDKHLESEKLTMACINCFNKNCHNIIPDKINIFIMFLDYLVRVKADKKFLKLDFDHMNECALNLKPSELIDILYLFGRLGVNNKELITCIPRILHNSVARGALTSYEKVKLARAYSFLKYEHITFFEHLSKELIYIFEQMELGLYNNETVKMGEKHVTSLASTSTFIPSGVTCSDLPYIDTINFSSNIDNIEFKGLSTQLYTPGQIIYILDSMIYLRLHHKEKYFDVLMNYVLKYCFRLDVLEHFDTEQMRCCISLLSNCKKHSDDEILEFITRRVVQEYMDGNVSNATLALFLKDLVKQTHILVRAKNRRNRFCYYSNFIPPQWINKPLHYELGHSGSTYEKSIIESCCSRICDTVHSFAMRDLTCCLRSIAYLGFKNEKFYNIFVPFFRERLSELTNVDVANITQTFNKVGIKNLFFFHLLGKQSQLYLNAGDGNHKLYVKRIG